MTESAPPAYAKGPGPQPYCADAPAAQSLALRVTLGDMPLSDAFEVVIPGIDAGASIGDLLDRVFGSDGVRDEAVFDALDTRLNPDLPEMYADMLDVFADWRDGRCSLRRTATTGRRPRRPTISRDTCAASRGLPRRCSTSSSSSGTRPWSTPPTAGTEATALSVVRRLQEQVMLHFVGRLGHELFDPESTPEAALLSIADRLVELGAIAADDGGGYSLTDAGENRLELDDAEVENSISLYDIFRDVAYDGDRVEFGSGTGSDMRVDVYEAEGIDAAEAVLHRQIHDGTLDELDADWRKAILDDEFFVELLIDLVDRERVDPADLEEIIEAGFAQLEEAREGAEREARRRRIDAQARRR